MTPLEKWESFYVIVGSSAGALVGLQFVVMALIADLPIIKGAAQTNDAFSTPTVVHFGVVLLLSAIASAPWSGMSAPSLLLGLGGIAGLIYAIVVARRVRKQAMYQLVFEDWCFHVVLPALAYAVLGASAYATRFVGAQALFGVAASALLLLFVGIHNAWDSVTYLVFVRRQEAQEESAPRDQTQG